MTAVHSAMHTRDQLLKMSIGLGLGLVFVHLFTFSILYVIGFSLEYLFFCCLLLLCYV